MFPLRVIHLDDGLTVNLSEMKYVGSYLEFYDSDDPEDTKEMLVLDRESRRVRILVDLHVVKRFELYGAPPLSEQDIRSILENAKRKGR